MRQTSRLIVVRTVFLLSTIGCAVVSALTQGVAVPALAWGLAGGLAAVLCALLLFRLHWPRGAIIACLVIIQSVCFQFAYEGFRDKLLLVGLQFGGTFLALLGAGFILLRLGEIGRV